MIPTEEEFLDGAPLRFRVLGTHDRFAVACYHQRGIPHLAIQEEGSRHRPRQPIMGEHEARAFYRNSQD